MDPHVRNLLLNQHFLEPRLTQRKLDGPPQSELSQHAKILGNPSAGGLAKAAKLTQGQRTAIASKAASARWIRNRASKQKASLLD